MIVFKDGLLFYKDNTNYSLDEFADLETFSNFKFRLIEDEVDIDNIEEIKLGTVCDARDLIINTLVQAVKQLNKEIKSIKEK